MFEHVVERLIQEAMQAGKFDGLEGSGRPADLGSYFETPAEIRLAQATLSNAGFVPREVELLNEIADLKAAGDSKDGSPPTSGDVQRLRRVELELALRLEPRART
jgi:hypothetical protein